MTGVSMCICVIYYMCAEVAAYQLRVSADTLQSFTIKLHYSFSKETFVILILSLKKKEVPIYIMTQDMKN